MKRHHFQTAVVGVPSVIAVGKKNSDERLVVFERPAHKRGLTVNTLPTIIVRHRKENPRKCSVLPLKHRPDILLLSYPVKDRPRLEDYIRLSDEGPPLSAVDAEFGLLLLDGSWRAARSMTRDFADVPPRSLSGYRSAYPRVSKLGSDPDNGLASVEALFIAYHILGRATAGLLDHYYWVDEFLRRNEAALSAHHPTGSDPFSGSL